MTSDSPHGMAQVFNKEKMAERRETLKVCCSIHLHASLSVQAWANVLICSVSLEKRQDEGPEHHRFFARRCLFKGILNAYLLFQLFQVEESPRAGLAVFRFPPPPPKQWRMTSVHFGGLKDSVAPHVMLGGIGRAAKRLLRRFQRPPRESWENFPSQ